MANKVCCGQTCWPEPAEVRASITAQVFCAAEVPDVSFQGQRAQRCPGKRTSGFANPLRYPQTGVSQGYHTAPSEGDCWRVTIQRIVLRTKTAGMAKAQGSVCSITRRNRTSKWLVHPSMLESPLDWSYLSNANSPAGKSTLYYTNKTLSGYVILQYHTESTRALKNCPTLK